jgi:uncharacterized membrane protein YfcA
MSLLLICVAGLLVGSILGLTGAGGSLLAVPALIYLAGLPAGDAVGVALVGVTVASVSGVIPRARAHLVDWKTVALLGVTGIPGSLIGTRLNTLATQTTLNIGFAIAMMVAIVATLRPPAGLGSIAGTRSRVATRGLLAMSGLLVGLLTGFLGMGGGFLIVPVLVALTGLPMASAVGVSLAVVALNSLTGLLAHLGSTDIGVPSMLAFGATTLPASLLASHWGTRANESAVKHAFCVVAGLSCGVMTWTAVNG